LYKGEKHIAVSFLLVFLLPVVYQPVHILGHHRHKYDCCVEFPHETKLGTPSFQNNEHCYVCEYEFTVTNLPDEFSIPYTEIFLDELKLEKTQNTFPYEVILHTSPRAPPFSS
jgi:hypothetical protein